jgi:hypothetical protein
MNAFCTSRLLVAIRTAPCLQPVCFKEEEKNVSKKVEQAVEKAVESGRSAR